MARLQWLWLGLFAAATCLPWPPAHAAGKRTVCTITVNSADEKQTFRRYLPEAKYRFVELVERGRPDWLASACHAGITCDVLLISGHFDGANQFFSDRLDVDEYLPVDEMERVSCSNSCPGLFSKLKEVHLYGCNTLNAAPQNGASREIVRSLVREGHTLKQAERHWKSLRETHGESSLDRMRMVFKGVPVIYGFSSVAPLGPLAASTLNAYFRRHGTREIARGRPGQALLRQFAPFAMTATRGMTDSDASAAVRDDICRFADDRLSDASKLGFVHQVLQRETAQARIYLDRIERLALSLQTEARRTPDVQRELDLIASDTQARARFLDFARDADRPEVRTAMVKLAHELGWLTIDEQWQELATMLGTLLALREVGLSEVALACTLNERGELDSAFNRRVPPGPMDDVAHAAVRACLGSAEGRARTLDGLTSADEADVLVAQSYLRQRPITDAAELRGMAARIVSMSASEAQVRALESLGRHYVSDRSILRMLVRLYARTPSWSVQAAIAGILMRADRRLLSRPGLLRTLREKRLPSPAGKTMLDALILRLQGAGPGR